MEKLGISIRLEVDYATERASIANLDDRATEPHIVSVAPGQDGYVVTDNAHAEPIVADTFVAALEHAWSATADTVAVELDPDNRAE